MSDPIDEYGDLDETSIFQALDDHDVEYVVVGGSAAILWGAKRATRDVHCVARQTTENHRRLCDALRHMGNPRLRIEGVDDEAAAELSKQLLTSSLEQRHRRGAPTAAASTSTATFPALTVSRFPTVTCVPEPRSLRLANCESLSPRSPTSLTQRQERTERRTVTHCPSSTNSAEHSLVKTRDGHHLKGYRSARSGGRSDDRPDCRRSPGLRPGPVRPLAQRAELRLRRPQTGKGRHANLPFESVPVEDGVLTLAETTFSSFDDGSEVMASVAIAC